MLQGKPEALAGVVHSLKTNFGLRFVYVWHGLSAYWSGVSTHDEPVAKYNPRIVYAEPTAGLAEIEPSMRWNPAVISGIGVPESAEQLYADMHSYLASSGGSAGRAEHYLVTVRSGAVLDSARRHAPEHLSAGYQRTAQPCSISWSFNKICSRGIFDRLKGNFDMQGLLSFQCTSPAVVRNKQRPCNGCAPDMAFLGCLTFALMSSAGITGVKVDCQAGVGLSGSVLGGGSHVARQYHDALEDSVMRNFPGNHCINCMCHTTENLYRYALSELNPNELTAQHVAACLF